MPKRVAFQHGGDAGGGFTNVHHQASVKAMGRQDTDLAVAGREDEERERESREQREREERAYTQRAYTQRAYTQRAYTQRACREQKKSGLVLDE